MFGHFHDGIIHSTKLTILNWLTAFCLTLFHIIKWIIFLFSNQNSLLINLLGDFSYIYGPRLLVDLIILFCEIFVLSIFIIFYFSSNQPKKMLFWLEQIEYDIINQRFSKLNLNQTNSKIFTRRISLLRINYNIFVYSLILIFFISANIAVFKFNKTYYLYYFISVVMHCPMFYINLSCIFGFVVILYQVNQYLIDFI